MPGWDGTGPLGRGPLTGRGSGPQRLCRLWRRKRPLVRLQQDLEQNLHIYLPVKIFY